MLESILKKTTREELDRMTSRAGFIKDAPGVDLCRLMFRGLWDRWKPLVRNVYVARLPKGIPFLQPAMDALSWCMSTEARGNVQTTTLVNVGTDSEPELLRVPECPDEVRDLFPEAYEAYAKTDGAGEDERLVSWSLGPACAWYETGNLQPYVWLLN